MLNRYECKSSRGFESRLFRVNNMRDNLVEELSLVENYIQFLDRRRTGGILYIPQEMVFPEGENDDGTGELQDLLMEVMAERVRFPESAAAIVPIIVRGPAEFHDKVRHFDMDNDFYATLCARAYKLKAEISEIDKRSESLV